MILNKLWNRLDFEPYEAKAANIITVVILALGTLGVISAVYPQHSKAMWEGLGTLLIWVFILFLVFFIIYVVWVILSDFLRHRR